MTLERLRENPAVLRLSEGVDLYIGDLALRRRSARTRDDYRRKLDVLIDAHPRADVGEITPDDCRRALARWEGRASGTIAHSVTVYNRFFSWLYDEGRIERNPMERIPRPRLKRPEELDVTTVSASDVRRMFEGCLTWQELLCLSVLAYLGPRRGAVSRLRRRDVDFERGTVRFQEKGGKIDVKPMPHDLLSLLRAADEAGALDPSPDSYVVPMQREQRRQGDRDDRIVWRLVRGVAARVGVRSHVHALRAAFAVHYLESHPGDLEALQALMGHRKLETTQIYLRKLDRERAMERVRDLSWEVPRFDALAVEARSGFEPLYEALQASA